MSALLRGGRRRAILALVAVVTVLAAGAAWRLRHSPIALPFLAEPIERSIAELVPDAVAEVGSVELVWSRRGPAIWVLDLEVRRREGTPIASLPRLSVRPSLPALLRGEFAIAAIYVTGARLGLVRQPDGQITAGGSAARLFASLLGASGRGAPGRLSRIGLTDAWVELDDRAEGIVWTAQGSEVTVRMRPAATVARVETRLVLRSQASRIFRRIEIPISATASLARDAGGAIAGATLEARGDDGTVLLAGERRPLPLRATRVRASVSSDGTTVDAQALEATVGPLQLKSTVRWSTASDALGVHGEFGALRIDDLPRLWPENVAPRTREWIVRNLSDGRITGGGFTLSFTGRTGGGKPPSPASTELRFRFAGLTLHYLRPLEPLQGARGSAKLTETRFEAQVEDARDGDLSIHHGRMTAELGRPGTPARVEFDASGPTRALLGLLDEPPLGIASRLGLPVGEVGGSSAVHGELRFPLSDASIPAVEVAATADLRDTTLPGLVDGVGLRGGTFRVRVENGRVGVEGETGFSGADWLPAPIHGGLSYEPGERASLRATFSGRGLEGEARASFEERVLRTLTVAHLRYRGTDLSGQLRRDRGGRLWISAVGDRLDLGPALRGFDARAPLEAAPAGAPWSLDARIGLVRLGPEVELADVNARAGGVGRHVREIAASGELEHGGDFRFALEPATSGPRVTLASDRGGELLKALGLYEHASGGHLTVDATVDRGTLAGNVDVGDVRVTQAPILARLLSLGSLYGIADLIWGEGITFRRARAHFSWASGRVELRQGTAVGSIGITADGTLDTRTDRIDLRGTLIPAYTLNSVLGKLPLLGKLLVGGEGQGVFGIDYRVGGTLREPEVSVNPLSALAPGALRTMFVDPFANKEPAPAEGSSGR